MQGTVRFYSSRGFGFIDMNNEAGTSYYYHLFDVVDRKILKPGDIVSFETIPNPRGPRCVHVQLIRRTAQEVPTCPQPATM